MRKEIVFLIAKQFWRNTFKSKAIYFLLAVFVVLLVYAAYNGYKYYSVQNDIRTTHQKNARKSWEDNSDKHPHRMAHFGSFAFRVKHKLSMFDFGMESFTGNAVFLEAHKQNTVNFSEASFSTGLLRFGEISMAMLLQIILPLIIFFLGFGAVASEKENGTLKLLLNQGALRKEIIIGKSLALMGLALLFYIPAVLAMVIQLCITDNASMGGNEFVRAISLAAVYAIFLWVICVITVSISALSKTAKEALLKLLGVWLLFAILLPKTMQAAGNYFFPSPSKFEFETAVEKDLIKEGDSHNPDDPHFKAIKDSLLRTYKIDSVQQLPFNYGGYLNMVSEQLSTEIYNRHLSALNYTFQKQNNFSRLASFINPVNAVKDFSMAYAGTDFAAYTHFQQQAEAYRYNLAQAMNTLQKDYISNKKQLETDKPYTVSHNHWSAFPDFECRFLGIHEVFKTSAISLAAITIWLLLSVLFISIVSRKTKAI